MAKKVIILIQTGKFYVDLPLRPHGPWTSYGVAIACVAAATSLRLAIGDRLPGTQFITMFPAVIAAATVAGLSSGLLAVTLAIFAAWYFVLPPSFSFQLPNAEQACTLGAFALVATGIVLLVSMLRTTANRMRDLNTLMFTTFDAHPDGVIITDRDGRIIDCNRRVQTTFGYPRHALIGAQIETLLPAPLRDRHRQHFSAYLTDPVPREMGTGRNLYARRANGSEFPVDVQIGPLRLRDQTLLMATVRDITEQRAAAAGLAESQQRQAVLEERARALEETRRWTDAFQNAALGIAIWDARTDTVQFANPALATMRGLTVQEACGRAILDVYVPQERARARAMIEVADRTGHTIFESVHRRKDGTEFPVQMHVTSAREPDGTVLYRIATAQDITERKRAEAMAGELRETDRRFQRIFDESPIGMVLATADEFRLVRVNDAFAKMLGYAAPDMVGHLRDEFAHPGDQNMPPPQEPGCATAWHPSDKRYLHASGRIVRAQVRVVRLGNDGGQNLVLGLAEDVTQQRQIERALYQSQRMEAVGNLAGGMAHDFNNLLAVIIGSLDIIATVPAVPAAATEMVEDALGAALRGADLTRSLLAFARRQPLRPAKLQVNDLIRDLVGMLARLLREDVTVSLDLIPDVWGVIADRAQLEAALMNLASNARDAMPNGGRLAIATSNRILDADYCGLHPDLRPGDYAMIEVADTGTGMLPDVAARIFDPFFTTKNAEKGTGLGLSMVFGYVRQSDGHIDVYSEPGVGTVFRLYLPRAIAADEASLPTPYAEPEPRGDGRTVLVVEDNIALRRVVIRQLDALGYAVVEADNAAAALTALAAQPVNVLFSDIVMPGELNGFELAERACARQADLKVVLTSGYPQPLPPANPAAPIRMTRLLQKPYRRQELAQALRAALDC